MIRSWHMALKDLRLLGRDPAALFWAFGFPILFALFFGFAFSGSGRSPSGLRVAVVDGDGSALSRRFTARLGSSEGVTTVALAREAALREVRRGSAAAAVLIGPEFEETLTGLFPSGNFLRTAPPLEVALDPGRKMEAGYLQGLLLQARFETLSDELLAPSRLRRTLAVARTGVNTAADLTSGSQTAFLNLIGAAESLLERSDVITTAASASSALRDALVIPQAQIDLPSEQRPDSYFQVAFPQAILWGLLGCVAAFAVSLVQERTKGTFQRLRIAPVSSTQILAGKGIACFLTALAVIGVLVVLGQLVFGTRISSLPLLGLVALCLALCFVGIMMFASTLGRTEQGVAGAGWALFLVMAMFGGGMLPLFVMPPWMQTASHASPIKWGILALEGIYWRQFSLAEMLLPCAILLGAGALFFTLGLLNMRRLK